MNPKKYFVTIYYFVIKASSVEVFDINIQSRLSYVTLQGTLLKRSHMTGDLLIQSPQNDQSKKAYTTSLEIVEIRIICMQYILYCTSDPNINRTHPLFMGSKVYEVSDMVRKQFSIIDVQ